MFSSMSSSSTSIANPSSSVSTSLLSESHPNHGRHVGKARVIALLVVVAVSVAVAMTFSHQISKPDPHSDFVFDGLTYTCSPGMYEHTKGCLYCPKGFKCPSGETQPEACTDGFYQPTKGKTKCIAADIGHYVLGKNATAEVPCVKGRYQGVTGQKECVLARLGHMVGSEGAHMDTPCAMDTYQDVMGMENCKACPTGEHQPFVGQSRCMVTSSNTPWASVVPFTSYSSLSAVMNTHGCPSGLFVTEPTVYSMVDVNPCHIGRSSIGLSVYGKKGGARDEIVIWTLTITTANDISCAGSSLKWGAPQSSRITLDCAHLADFGKLKLIYDTGIAGRTFQNAVNQKSVVVDGIQHGYSPAMQIHLEDGRVVILDGYQEVASVVGGLKGYMLSRWWRDVNGNEMMIELSGDDACTYCEYVVKDGTTKCNDYVAGDVIDVMILNPAAKFKCFTNVFLQLPHVAGRGTATVMMNPTMAPVLTAQSQQVGTHSPTRTQPNLALNRVATQFELTAARKSPQIAVDGKKSQCRAFTECSIIPPMAGGATGSFWSVDLGSRYVISSIAITASIPTPHILFNFKIFVTDRVPTAGTQFFATDKETCDISPGQFASKVFKCDNAGLTGRYVGIQTMTAHGYYICEVEVFGKTPSPNAALNMATGQSATSHGGVSSRAVDGNHDGNYGGNSCTYTGVVNAPFWWVDLGKEFEVDGVAITNRAGSHKLKDFNIFVRDEQPGTGFVAHAEEMCVLNQGTFQGTKRFNCPHRMMGRFVGIQLIGVGELTICEVEVYGEPSRNLALNEATGSSSTLNGGVSWRAVDGNKNNVFSSGSCTETNSELHAFWFVDLQRIYDVKLVEITNRAMHSNRLNDFDVFVSFREPTAGFVATAEEMCVTREATFTGTKMFACKFNVRTIGRYVGVQLRGVDFLSLCEVDVFGKLAKNVALLQRAWQSTLGNSAQIVVNGRRNHWCSDTQVASLSSWSVDLGRWYTQVRMGITSTTVGSGQMGQFNVVLTDRNPATTVAFTATTAEICDTSPGGFNGTRYFSCGSKSGEYVAVQGANTMLRLCEVEVFAFAPTVSPTNLNGLYFRYSSRMGDSCAGLLNTPCHGEPTSSKLGCISKYNIPSTIPLYWAYSERMGDSCAGISPFNCHGESGTTIGYVWNRQVDVSMVQMYLGYSERMGDSCLGVHGTACHDPNIMHPIGAWMYPPGRCAD